MEGREIGAPGARARWPREWSSWPRARLAEVGVPVSRTTSARAMMRGYVNQCPVVGDGVTASRISMLNRSALLSEAPDSGPHRLLERGSSLLPSPTAVSGLLASEHDLPGGAVSRPTSRAPRWGSQPLSVTPNSLATSGSRESYTWKSWGTPRRAVFSSGDAAFSRRPLARRPGTEVRRPDPRRPRRKVKRRLARYSPHGPWWRGRSASMSKKELWRPARAIPPLVQASELTLLEHLLRLVGLVKPRRLAGPFQLVLIHHHVTFLDVQLT